nr:hypothetical protein [Ancylomarina sp. DW003]
MKLFLYANLGYRFTFILRKRLAGFSIRSHLLGMDIKRVCQYYMA